MSIVNGKPPSSFDYSSLLSEEMCTFVSSPVTTVPLLWEIFSFVLAVQHGDATDGTPSSRILEDLHVRATIRQM